MTKPSEQSDETVKVNTFTQVFQISPVVKTRVISREVVRRG